MITLLAIFHGLVWGWATSLCFRRGAIGEILLGLALAVVAGLSGAAQAGAAGAAVAGFGFLLGIAAHRGVLNLIQSKGEAG